MVLQTIQERKYHSITIILAWKMIYLFASLDNRRKLLFRLQRASLQARMHSYEYFIRKNRFVCILALSPTRNSATIYKAR